jgi:hypothetical protein
MSVKSALFVSNALLALCFSSGSVASPRLDSGEGATAPETLNSSEASTSNKSQTATPPKMRHSLGVELSDADFGVLGTTAINYGYMMQSFGLEIYLGYNKASDTVKHTETLNQNDISTPKSKITIASDSGKVNPTQLTFGLQPKFVLFSDRWFRATTGLMLAYSTTSTVSYKTGTTTTTVSDTSQPANYTVSQADTGTVSVTTQPRIILGPRFGTDFFLRWFPHLSLGFSTGILMGSGGVTTTKTNTEDKVFAVSNGAEQSPTIHTITSATEEQKPGTTKSTVAVGGTVFNLFGSFNLRYVW